MKLTDEQKEELGNLVLSIGDGRGNSVLTTDLCDDFVEEIEKIIGWINVEKDGLPEDEYSKCKYLNEAQRYLLCIKDSVEPVKGNYWNGKWIADGYYGNAKLIVTDYMPLPKKPAVL